MSEKVADLERRACGTCTACCTTHAVPELKKPAFKTCDMVCESGCEIYDERPDSCRNFECAWLQDQGRFRRWLPDERTRPDRLGLVLVSYGRPEYVDGKRRTRIYVMVYETKPHAATRGRGSRVIEKLSNVYPVLLTPFRGDGEMYRNGRVVNTFPRKEPSEPSA